MWWEPQSSCLPLVCVMTWCHDCVMTPIENHTPRRTIRIDDDLWAQVAAYAEAEGTSASEVVREALAAILDRDVMRFYPAGPGSIDAAYFVLRGEPADAAQELYLRTLQREGLIFTGLFSTRSDLGHHIEVVPSDAARAALDE